MVKEGKLFVRTDDLTETLRAYKRKHNLTLMQLSGEAGISENIIRKLLWNHGQKATSLEAADKICTMLDIPLPQVYKYDLVPVD